MFKNLNLLWIGIGAAAGYLVVPSLLTQLGINLGAINPVPFDPWNANFGTYRPMGKYGIGQLYHGRGDWAGTMRGPILQYRGGKMGTWEGQTGELAGNLGEAWSRGMELLPFGLPWEYRK